MINQYGNKMTPAAQNLYIGKKKTSMPNTTILIPPPAEIAAYACLVQSVVF
jgi:hypothetical protein